MITETTASVATSALPETPTDIRIEISSTPVPVMPPLTKPKTAPAASSAPGENVKRARFSRRRSGMLASRKVPSSAAIQRALSSV